MHTNPRIERLRRALDLFRELADIAPELRTAELGARTGGDEHLRAEVMRLLAADAIGHAALDQGAQALAAVFAHDGREHGAERLLGRQIGPYRLVTVIGEGGMGSVYRGERVAGDFEQTVAIKFLSAARHDAAADERFTRERQILARLDHPNIARVFDGGRLGGMPWFAMAYVEGVALDQYCREHDLNLTARLRLFVKVLVAVQHAHQNLIVHRDLKPSNILIDAGGEPRLLDFGVAKLLDAPLASNATHAPLTPLYAAPEQINGGAITTATDIFSLGVILYELLSGQHPHRLQAANALALLQAITDGRSEAPSLVLARDSGRAREARRLRGDLDTIVLTCLRREPARRYGSAAALKDDIELHLAGHPIAARPDSPGYRMGKFITRHRLGVGVAAVAILGLVAATTVSVQQAERAERESIRAGAFAATAAIERDAALAEARRQEALTQHFVAVLNRASEHAGEVTSEQLLQWASDPRLLGEFGDAGMRRTIKLAVSDMLVQRNDFVQVLALLAEVEPDMAQASVRERLLALGNRTEAEIRLGKLDAAEQSLNAAEALLPRDENLLVAATLRSYRGQILRARGRLPEALQAAGESAQLALIAQDASPLGRGQTIGSAAVAKLMGGDLDGAIALAAQAQNIWSTAKVPVNASTLTVATVPANALFLRGNLVTALQLFESLSATSGASESPPARASRDATHAKTLALLGRRDEALALGESAQRSICDTLGGNSLDCLRMRLSIVDTAQIAGDYVRALAGLDIADALLATHPLPPLQASAAGFRSSIRTIQSPTSSNVEATIARFSAIGTTGLSQRNVVRALLVLAEKLHASGNLRQAETCARAALAASAGLDGGGMDHSLLQLWQARLDHDTPPSAALDELEQALGAQHAWVAAHRIH